ncbi:hypothetical protein jhhlp_005146 [Lomentospora prolificans]|uniref:Uncharacterized protein n=1 Tax=Lomentospora prolificans TaxID=41688 RepID=A0A2N3N7M6_9PEZI|nr:hypothetical protein jhhlp_005146 [Lomentospora prolificans]
MPASRNVARDSRSVLELKSPSISLDAAGLVALADLTTIQQRTTLTGTAVLFDVLILCPGIHLQQESVSLNGGEYPACAALTTGYVFRVENPATVYYLQQVSLTGHLTNVEVSRVVPEEGLPFWDLSTFYSHNNATLLSTLAYTTSMLWTLTVILLTAMTHDWWALSVLFMLMFARLCNVIVLRRRASGKKWSGAPEPDVQGDLLVLLSQDRWVRIKGSVDDLKKCTSGQWLRDETNVESWFIALATLSVYLAAALVSNAESFSQILLLCLFAGSAGLLAIANFATRDLQMHGTKLRVVGNPREYSRRKDLADELIKETNRDDWAVRMAMIVKSKCEKCNKCDCKDVAAIM